LLKTTSIKNNKNSNLLIKNSILSGFKNSQDYYSNNSLNINESSSKKNTQLMDNIKNINEIKINLEKINPHKKEEDPKEDENSIKFVNKLHNSPNKYDCEEIIYNSNGFISKSENRNIKSNQELIYSNSNPIKVDNKYLSSNHNYEYEKFHDRCYSENHLNDIDKRNSVELLDYELLKNSYIKLNDITKYKKLMSKFIRSDRTDNIENRKSKVFL